MSRKTAIPGLVLSYGGGVALMWHLDSTGTRSAHTTAPFALPRLLLDEARRAWCGDGRQGVTFPYAGGGAEWVLT